MMYAVRRNWGLAWCKGSGQLESKADLPAAQPPPTSTARAAELPICAKEMRLIFRREVQV